MGIVHGPRAIILNFIEEMRAHVARGHADANEGAVVAHGVTPEDVAVTRAMFEENINFRNTYLYGRLDQERLPDDAGLHALTRIACKRLVDRMLSGGRSVTVAEEQTLARNILELFPHLEQTRVSPNAPPESIFFWLHNGNPKGPHTGMIFHHVHNQRRNLRDEDKLFTRRQSNPNDAAGDHEEEMALLQRRAELISDMEASRANEGFITEEMFTCFPLLQEMLQQAQPLQYILLVLPHLLSYDLITQAFRQLHPETPSEPHLDRVLMVCTFLNIRSFSDVEDLYVRGCFRLCAAMPNRGQTALTERNLLDGVMEHSLLRWFMPTDADADDPIEQYEAGEQFTYPHIVCLAAPAKKGSYYVYVGGHTLKANNVYQAIETWFRLFQVFGLHVPPTLSLFWDFLAIAVFRVLEVSTREAVNTVVRTYESLRNLRAQQEAGPSGESRPVV